MTNPTTVNKLIAMHLSAMADAFTIQMEDPKAGSASFEERFAALVDIEYTTRKSNTLKRLIKTAAFEQPSAHIADIDYKSGRKLDKELIHRLATCEYITEFRNVFITGATGSGKTYLACALGMEACKQYYKTQYVRLPDLLMELDLTQESASFQKVLAKYDALTAHVSLAFIRYMLLSLQQRNNSDERTISELFLLMIDELADITFGHALQLIVDIMLQMIQERFGLSDEQLNQFVADFVGRLPVSYQRALQLKDA